MNGFSEGSVDMFILDLFIIINTQQCSLCFGLELEFLQRPLIKSSFFFLKRGCSILKITQSRSERLSVGVGGYLRNGRLF